MELEIFALCDAATEYGGKLNLLGAFDSIYTRQFPAFHPHCAIALRIRFEPIEAGNHRVKINFVNADGKSIIPSVEGNIEVKFAPAAQSACANLVLNLNGLKFEAPGQYALDLAIDSRHEKSIPVNIVQVKEPQSPPPLGEG